MTGRHKDILRKNKETTHIKSKKNAMNHSLNHHSLEYFIRCITY